MNQVKKSNQPDKIEHQFQIRKVPLKRIFPDKNPDLNALDVHSICLPSNFKSKHQWEHLRHDLKYNNKSYEHDFNQQILSSQAYKEMYSRYLKLREEGLKQKQQLQHEITALDHELSEKVKKKEQLHTLREGFYEQIEDLRDKLTEQRDHNYNLRWQLYNQRGTQYANLHGYSFLEANQLTYEQLLQMQEQMGSVNNGLTLEQIEKLQKKQYEPKEGTQYQQQICCICYDEIGKGEWITILKCRHSHHCDCIKDWLVKQKICPICKSEVIPQEYEEKIQQEQVQEVQQMKQEYLESLYLDQNPQDQLNTQQ